MTNASDSIPTLPSEQGRARGRIGETFLAAGAFALLSAAWYAGSFGVQFWLKGEIVNVSRDIAWMAPVSSLVFFFAVAIPGALLALALPLGVARRLAFGGFGGAAVLAVLITYSQIAHYASVILALGAGVAVSRLAGTHPVSCLRWARVTTIGLASLFSIVALSIAVTSRTSTSRAMASLPPAALGAPNVLLIVLDAARASALSSYGSPRKTTPFLDSLAKEGVLFERAFSVAPWTLPSHESMFTGEYQFVGGRSSSFLKRPIDDGKVVLPMLFKARGYETAAFVANFFYTGWDSELDRGFIRYADYPRSVEQILRSSSLGQTQTARRMYSNPSVGGIARALSRPDLYVNPKPSNSLKKAGVLTDEFLSWFEAREPRPFFVFMNYFDAHQPYEPPPPFDKRFAPLPHNRHMYDGAIAYMDHEIKRLLQGLAQRGALDNTLLIITSDHGELFGEHRLTGHHNSLFVDVLHVPLILRFPARVPPNTRVKQAVTLRDLAATILDLTQHPDSAMVPGTTLAARWRDSLAVGSPLFAALERGVRVDSTLPFATGGLLSMLDNDWQYIRNSGTGTEQLFRYRDDPAERTNLISSPSADSVAQRFRRSVKELLAAGPGGKTKR